MINIILFALQFASQSPMSVYGPSVKFAEACARYAETGDRWDITVDIGGELGELECGDYIEEMADLAESNRAR